VLLLGVECLILEAGGWRSSYMVVLLNYWCACSAPGRHWGCPHL